MQGVSSEKIGVTSPAFSSSSSSVLIHTFSVSIVVWKKKIIISPYLQLIKYMNIATRIITEFAPSLTIGFTNVN